MNKKERRSSYRIPYAGQVLVLWEDGNDSRYMQGKCLDVSERGMRIEVPGPIPLRTRIIVRIERINLSGSASVRHVRRSGNYYLLGLEMSQELKCQALASAHDLSAIRLPAPVA